MWRQPSFCAGNQVLMFSGTSVWTAGKKKVMRQYPKTLEYSNHDCISRHYTNLPVCPMKAGELA